MKFLGMCYKTGITIEFRGGDHSHIIQQKFYLCLETNVIDY